VSQLLELPADAPVVAEGRLLLPDLVASVAASPERACYVLASRETQQRLLNEHRSDPHRGTAALTARLARDEVLARRIRERADELGFAVLEIDDVTETAAAVADRFLPVLRPWLEQPDVGDIAGRRRELNRSRARYLRARMLALGAERPFKLGCECSRRGCLATVTLPPEDVDAALDGPQPLLADEHR
jgi:hypothetical protein